MPLQQLEQNVNQATQGLADYQKNMKNPTTLLNEAMGSLGIPEIRTRVGNLRTSLLNTENLLSGVEGSVQGRTGGSLVTEAQRQRLTSMERQPIAEQLGKMQGAYGTETANLSDLMGEASQTVNYGIEGQRQGMEQWKTKLSGAESAYGRALEQEKMRRAQEAAAKEAAESKRRFDLEMAHKKSTSGTGKKGKAMSLGDSIKDLVMNQGLTWGRAARQIESIDGKKIAGGSDTDVYLKYYFGLREKNPGKYMSSADMQKAAKLGLTKG